MNDRLRARLAAQGGVLTFDDLVDLDFSKRQIDVLLHRGVLFRVRRGAYVDAELYQSSEPSERYRLDGPGDPPVRPGDAASHHAALAVHRLPTFGVDWDRIDLIGQVTRVKTARTAGRAPV